ncbi:MAG: cytidylate kinase-like family protein [Acidobacteria bacterium]|nr:MAG: cytidylate kinase-like family protein [Acidobacteriota bacterium]
MSTFRIITVEREFGSGGGAIATQIADRLSWKLWDQALTQEIARIAKVDCSAVERCEERLDGRLHRLAKAFWRGSYEPRALLTDAQTFDADCMVSTMQQIMERIAEQGQAVVVGRGAPYFLREREDTFRLFVYAPTAEKIRRLRELGKSEREAEELVESVDRDRIAYVKHYFDADWPTRSLYHLMINTSMGDENVIATVLNSMRLLEEKSAGKTSQLRGVL